MTTLPARRVVLTAALSMSLAVAGAFSPRAVSAQSYGPGARVAIYQYMFHPAVMTIPVGTTVTWTNYDPFAHTSTSDTGVWNSGSINPGASYQYTFNTPGTFPYHCMIHPFMHGVIIVVQAVTSFLAASPNPVRNGGTTIIFGQGFTPHTWVFVSWHRPDGTMGRLWIFTSRAGAFAFRLFADPRHGCGPRIFMAFNSATRTWTAPFILNEIC